MLALGDIWHFGFNRSAVGSFSNCNIRRNPFSDALTHRLEGCVIAIPREKKISAENEPYDCNDDENCLGCRVGKCGSDK